MCAVTFTVTHKANPLAIFCQKLTVMLENKEDKLYDIIAKHAHVTSNCTRIWPAALETRCEKFHPLIHSYIW